MKAITNHSPQKRNLMKSKKGWVIRYYLLVLLLAIVLIPTFILLHKTGNEIIWKALAIIAAVGSLYGKLSKRMPSVMYDKYSTAYKELLEGAFVNDKKSYRKLVEACYYWDKQNYNKAHEILDKLLPVCSCSRDFYGVYKIKSICYNREGRPEQSIEVYKKMLSYDINDASSWASLGYLYLLTGRLKEAGETFHTALQYGHENFFLYNNYATYHIKTGNAKEALKYARKAMELEPSAFIPISAAAIACGMLGDQEGYDYYSRLYVEKGGKPGKL